MPLYSQALPGSISYLLGKSGKRRVFPDHLWHLVFYLHRVWKKKPLCFFWHLNLLMYPLFVGSGLQFAPKLVHLSLLTVEGLCAHLHCQLRFLFFFSVCI